MKTNPELPIYSLSVGDIFSQFQTTQSGLNTDQVKISAEKYGLNKIVIESKVPLWKKLIDPFVDPLVALLGAAGILSFVVGEVETGAVFMIIIAINAGLDFWQNYQAENILNSLKGFLKKTANVRRDGSIQEISAENLVPGDVVFLDEGDAVPADIRVIKDRRLQVNSFALTGESVPQQKSAHPIFGTFAPADRTNMLHMGSTIVTGSGEGIVVGTGMNTVFGNIASLSSEENEDETPLQKELSRMANRNFIMALVIMVIMFFLSLYVLEKPLLSTIIFGIVVATSMVPQGLPLEINLSLLLGVFRLGKRNAIVKKLDAVEALGSASLICTDKTGTLTRNEMNAEFLFGEGFEMQVKGTGYEPTAEVFLNQTKISPTSPRLRGASAENLAPYQSFFTAAFFNNHARLCEADEEHPDYYVIGDPTEGALRVLGKRVKLDEAAFWENHKEIDEVPFDSNRKMMSTIFTRKNDNQSVVFTKGAAESVIARCTHYQDFLTGKVEPMTAEKSAEILDRAGNYSQEAYRILAIAQKVMKPSAEYETDNAECDLIYLGCAALMDLPRAGVAEAFRVSSAAHIKTIMITGDNLMTAKAIASKIELISGKENSAEFCCHGADLDEMSDADLIESIETAEACIFARVSPEQKLRIVKLMKSVGEIVAVTGDGVNDAPALRQAHIGVSMGKIGTSVAKEASQIVLADDSYSTLVHAIKEGRTIYQNLVKTVKSCYTSNFGELFVILFGIFFATRFAGAQPLMPVQILLIDLLGEIAPLIMLTFDPLYKGAMEKPPRNMNRGVLNKISITDIITTGLFMGIASFAAFAITFDQTQDPQMSSTAAYLMLIFAQYINILSRRYHGFIFSAYFWTNRYFWLSLVATLAVVFGLIYSPIGALESISFKPLAANLWPAMFGIIGVVLILIETKKQIINWWTVKVYGEL